VKITVNLTDAAIGNIIDSVDSTGIAAGRTPVREVKTSSAAAPAQRERRIITTTDRTGSPLVGDVRHPEHYCIGEGTDVLHCSDIYPIFRVP
jgi:hypothetical protein